VAALIGSIDRRAGTVSVGRRTSRPSGPGARVARTSATERGALDATRLGALVPFDESPVRIPPSRPNKTKDLRATERWRKV
jgi:hypothetical protein